MKESRHYAASESDGFGIPDIRSDRRRWRTSRRQNVRRTEVLFYFCLPLCVPAEGCRWDAAFSYARLCRASSAPAISIWK